VNSVRLVPLLIGPWPYSLFYTRTLQSPLPAPPSIGFLVVPKMLRPTERKKVQWSPHHSNKFVVGGNDLRLYEIRSSVRYDCTSSSCTFCSQIRVSLTNLAVFAFLNCRKTRNHLLEMSSSTFPSFLPQVRVKRLLLPLHDRISLPAHCYRV